MKRINASLIAWLCKNGVDRNALKASDKYLITSCSERYLPVSSPGTEKMFGIEGVSKTSVRWMLKYSLIPFINACNYRKGKTHRLRRPQP